jgi:hypothetical protein
MSSERLYAEEFKNGWCRYDIFIREIKRQLKENDYIIQPKEKK